MNICLCYIVVTHGKLTWDYASRFVSTYHEYPPGVEHDTLIICNGGPLKTEQAMLFTSMSAKFWPHANDDGWDISAYIDAAKGPCADYDMMVCLGESNYFHREGWMLRLSEAWQRHGPGMYGPYGTNVVRTHLQTTAFACAPKMLTQYPRKMASRKDRYEFEHGEQALWRRLMSRGYPVRLVTWDGEWPPNNFRVPPNIMWRGDQSNLLMFCNHSDGYRDADLVRKSNWSRSADRPAK